MAQAKYTLYKYVRFERSKWRYCRAALYKNHTVKPNVVVYKGKELTCSDGDYYLNHSGRWINVGPDALEAQREQRRLLDGTILLRASDSNPDKYKVVTVPTIHPPMVNGRKKLQDEIDAYIANLELAKRVCTTVNDKRRFLTWFLEMVGKEYVDEIDRNSVLAYRNKLFEQGYAPKSVDTMMMCIVTFSVQIL